MKRWFCEKLEPDCEFLSLSALLGRRLPMTLTRVSSGIWGHRMVRIPQVRGLVPTPRAATPCHTACCKLPDGPTTTIVACSMITNCLRSSAARSVWQILYTYGELARIADCPPHQSEGVTLPLCQSSLLGSPNSVSYVRSCTLTQPSARPHQLLHPTALCPHQQDGLIRWPGTLFACLSSFSASVGLMLPCLLHTTGCGTWNHGRSALTRWQSWKQSEGGLPLQGWKPLQADSPSPASDAPWPQPRAMPVSHCTRARSISVVHNARL